MAAEKGFYKEAGADIEVKPADPQIKGFHDILFRKGDFETGWLASGIIMRANVPHKKLVLIAQYFQKPALMLVAKKSSGIGDVRDFRGKTLGVWDGVFSVVPRALVKKHNIHGVKIVSQGFTVEPFLTGKIDIASAMRYNEYKQILDGLKNDPLIIFDFAELGINLPEDGLYVREDFLDENPAVCRKVVEATLKGWQYAFSHKDETVALITEIANKTEYKTTPETQRWMLDVVEELIDMNQISLKKEDFERAADMLKSLKMIRTVPSYEEFYRNPAK
jgi:NitT/TauT family transport system substrate-binding protein